MNPRLLARDTDKACEERERPMTETFNYAGEGEEKWGPQAAFVRQDIVNVHRQTWKAIACAGSFWSDVDRLEIAKQARAARSQRSDLPFNRSYPDSRLNRDTLETVRKVAADAGKIDRLWAKKQIASIGDGPYAELVAIVASVSAVDAFSEALGRPKEMLPKATGGSCSGVKSDNATDIGGYLPMVDPWDGPNVSRALSLVPAANALFMQNVSSMYVGKGGGFNDMVWDGPLSRPQAELLAARVSSVNECFY